MTKDTFPDVIWCDKPEVHVGIYLDYNPLSNADYIGKYFLAEPIITLLQQARKELSCMSGTDDLNIISAIDKFLENTNIKEKI